MTRSKLTPDFPPQPDDPRLLTPPQAAAVFAISPRKLWAMTASGDIPHVRIGRCVRYPVGDLQQWIRENTNGGEK
ncbi:MAG: helix-turn-helix domain-containing protein [Planctomycetaceae bacterium]|nr:helix-turn-helix domain-containing protein [Planctomycetaceae bacterium]MBT6485517.1 helix-turn-helix domain-containing protein [Planctomycetaceae bacterium]